MPRDDDYLAVLTTTDTEDRARELAATAVDERLAACAQIDGPIRSLYRWDGKVQDDQEWRVLYKTSTDRYPELEAHIKSVHTYDTPEIIAVPITEGSGEYLSWLRAETRP
ncbi:MULTISPECIES: divalent-cation tolerance protein CutA [Streptomycetaceae]|uniref:Putative divalent ion tolerance protein n=1 Tax=Streptantibioticus cattleyicolor (strain ATCC 35852 / DSM 46488 / JCM 4925 / NBRC 14057 / NRRL 8057) TaxID=1003195 RepID=F8JX05_STREN|nr:MULTISPECIES: divalent-cation tolerance protein CutA [Streptomycetaceae]AEW93275.1 putative divalent ion tolerance protein [Streptantibioticus cattleyicolor NRRL 8057 = DSM 46488]MYS57996.1 divalent cation tolerance protein CutA [Streptomyces sp. SID5468]CCB73635.1 Divalent-cation tolerance protein cutA [Streptantibioticus cattleyicolor NRRL 8057 = DSM 46488]